MNGSMAIPVKNRPRIPTPDVTKEILDKENNRFTTNVANIQSHLTSGVALMPHHLQSSYPGYPGSDVPVVQVVLSPIQELDGTGSVNNTLHPGQPSTAALAQAVLSPGLGPVLTTTPMTVSQLTSMGLTSVTSSPLFTKQMQAQTRSPSFIRAFQTEIPQGAKVTEMTTPEDEAERQISSRNSNTSVGSDASNISKDTKESLASNHSNTTASVTSKKSLDAFEPDSSILKLTSTPITTELINLTANMSSPASMVSLASNEVRSRKTSATSQSNGPTTGSPKRGEVYV